MSPRCAYGSIAWIVQCAAHLAPESIRHRLEEEWLADLLAHGGPLPRLRFALGCCWAALAMRGDRFAATPSTAELRSARPRVEVDFPFARRRDRIRDDTFTWLARLRRGLRGDEGSELREWLRRRSHRTCMARAAAERNSPEDLAVLSEIFQINPGWVVSRQGRSPTINALAALGAICMAALPLLYTHYHVPGLILGPAIEGSFAEAVGTVYASGSKSLRRVGLPDETRVVMNRGTRIAVLYSDHIRDVRLVRGEATFTVPREAARAFELTVGDRHFRTEAATFNVRLRGRDSIEITVLEGIVTVPPSPAVATVNPAAALGGDVEPLVPTLLKAGQTIDTAPGKESARTLITWQRG
jgi:ferric-dicitrate binding protein FerR (iron transport regulator)